MRPAGYRRRRRRALAVLEYAGADPHAELSIAVPRILRVGVIACPVLVLADDTYEQALAALIHPALIDNKGV
jgi:hypothetical protein